MTEINAAYLEFRYSGGDANTNPQASLGGGISSTKVSKFNAKYYALGNSTSVTNNSAFTVGGSVKIIDVNGFDLTDSNKTPVLGDTVNKNYVGLKIKDGVMGLFSTRITELSNISASSIEMFSPAIPWTVHPSPVILEGVGKYILRLVSTRVFKNGMYYNYDPVLNNFKDLEVLNLKHSSGITASDLTVGRQAVQPMYISQDADLFEVNYLNSTQLRIDEEIVQIKAKIGYAEGQISRNGAVVPHQYSNGDVIDVSKFEGTAVHPFYCTASVKVLDDYTFVYEYPFTVPSVQPRLSGLIRYSLFDKKAEIISYYINEEEPHFLSDDSIICLYPIARPKGTYLNDFNGAYDVEYDSPTRFKITRHERVRENFTPFVIEFRVEGFLAICRVLSDASVSYHSLETLLDDQYDFTAEITGGNAIPHGFLTGDVVEIKVPMDYHLKDDGYYEYVEVPENTFLESELITNTYEKEKFAKRFCRSAPVTVIDELTFSFPLLVSP